MQINGWKYYNHAAIPTSPPHEDPDLTPVETGDIWKINGALLARWTSDFDTQEATNFWYVIIDHPFDISKLKSKRRYEINKGLKNYEIRKVNLEDVKEQVYKVWADSLIGYKGSYKPTVSHDDFIKWISSINNHVYYAAYSIESGEMDGIALLSTGEVMRNFSALKTRPSTEKLGINAALVYGMLEDNKEFLSSGGYICDGARNVFHQTNFQDYLEKYFDFRKAYCHLNIKYKRGIGFIVHCLYPFRKLLNKMEIYRLSTK